MEAAAVACSYHSDLDAECLSSLSSLSNLALVDPNLLAWIVAWLKSLTPLSFEGFDFGM